MLLVDILARKLKEWPDKAVAITQDTCGEVWPLSRLDDSVWFDGYRWKSNSCFNLGTDIIPGAQVAEDHANAIVTRADWQAAKDKLEGKTVKKPNANKDGWVRHRGGKCPVEAGVRVDYRMRDGYISTSLKGGESLRWNHDGTFGDIMAYRIHTPSEQPATAEESSPVEPVAPIAGPLQWRDRITEIDAELKAENERHNAAMGKLNSERAELVQKLASEGLALIERKADPAEDMSDPANWKAGDILECVNREWTTFESFSIGSNYKLLRNDGLKASEARHWLKVEDADGDDMSVPASEFKWHSRPAN